MISRDMATNVGDDGDDASCHSCCLARGSIHNSNSKEFMGASQTVIVDESLLAKEMNAMTVQERELLLEEVHGVSGIPEETPEFVQRSLRDMREALTHLPKPHRKALDRAFFLRPRLETDDRLHLMFLRAVRFDPTLAAKRMAQHYSHKLRLFGEDKLVKKIELDDLSPRAQGMIYCGAAQFLSSKDTSGRGIILLNLAQYELEDPLALLQSGWYQFMSVVQEDEEVQKRGVVKVLNVSGKWKSTAGQVIQLLLKNKDLFNDWPFRVCVLHLCYNQPVIRSVTDTFHALIGREMWIRQRSHYGSLLEAQYALSTFGIQMPDWFTQGDGVPSKDYVDDFLEQCRQNEAENRQRIQEFEQSHPGCALYPIREDVLLGRGRPFHSWHGNVGLVKIVASYADRYAAANDLKGGKAKIALEIVRRLQREGGRFLQRTTLEDGPCWETVDDEVAKEKVSQIMRAEIRRLNSSNHHRESSSLSPPKMRHDDTMDSSTHSVKRPRIN